MIVSYNKKPSIQEFDDLVKRATDLLNLEAKERPDYFLSRHAQKLEDDVFNALQKVAENTPFEGSICKISGQRFPDIVASRYYGVEVKSSKDQSWTTLGGSVNESTRVDEVERIYLLFGKLAEPVEFKSRPYQDCLSDIVVTHYPRYKIDMNLGDGQTIFDKMHTEYDVLRKKTYPIRDIVKYYKGILGKGERLWWLDDGTDDLTVASDSATVRLWNTLKTEEKTFLIVSAYAFFPEIVSRQQDKYDNLSLWLVSNYGVVSTSLRDSFSAGGKVVVHDFPVPRSLYNMFLHKEHIKQRIMSVDESVLMDLWNVNHIEKDRFVQWVYLIVSHNESYSHIIKQVLLN